MLNFFAKRLKALHEVPREERGFTLIELLVVVIIIGILAAIAIPTFLNQREKAQVATTKSDVRNAVTMQHIAAADSGTGLPNGTYNTANPIVVGQDQFVPSDNVSIVIATAGTGKSITGTYTGVTGSYAYNTATGAYTKTGAAYQ